MAFGDFARAARRATKAAKAAKRGASYTKAGRGVSSLASAGARGATRGFSGKGRSSSGRSSYSPPPRRSNSGGGGGGGSFAPRRSNSVPTSSTGQLGSNVLGGAGTGGFNAVQPPAPPSIDEWLAGDTAYLSQTDALEKALADYQAEMERNKAQYQTEYDTNLSNLGTSRTAALTDLENDFAGRGLLNSGLYANSTSELMSDYDARQNALEQGRSNFLADLLAQFQNFQSEQDLSRTSARQDAINRRAAQFGL